MSGTVGIVTVTDNWWAIRIASSGRLLAVGTWLPPVCENIMASMVSHEEARVLLAELEARSHNKGPVGSIVLEG